MMVCIVLVAGAEKWCSILWRGSNNSMKFEASSMLSTEEGTGGEGFLNIRSSHQLTRNAHTFHTLRSLYEPLYPIITFKVFFQSSTVWSFRILAENFLGGSESMTQPVSLSMPSGSRSMTRSNRVDFDDQEAEIVVAAE